MILASWGESPCVFGLGPRKERCLSKGSELLSALLPARGELSLLFPRLWPGKIGLSKMRRYFKGTLRAVPEYLHTLVEGSEFVELGQRIHID